MKKIAAALFIGFLSSTAVQAQDLEMQALLDRLERMDRDIKALNIRVYREGGATSAPSVATSGGSEISGPLGARLSVRMTELENQIRELTGQLEETAFRISQMTTRMDKMVADVDYRLTVLEGGNPAARPQTGALSDLQPQVPGAGVPNPQFAGQPLTAPGAAQNTGGVAPTPGVNTLPPASEPGVLGTLTEQDLNSIPSTRNPQALSQTQTEPVVQAAAIDPAQAYENSRQMLLRGDYVGAESSFKTFITDHVDHQLIGNARYWLGETYYVQGDYAQAAATFLEGYQKTPRGAKAPDSLLKLGMSLVRMEKSVEACSAFSRLRASFPKMPANLSKTLERERASAQCS